MCYWVGATNQRMLAHTETVSDRLLHTHGEQIQPDVERDMLRTALVEGLCEVWGVDLDKYWIATMRDIRYIQTLILLLLYQRS
jgi:hypothetical protein